MVADVAFIREKSSNRLRYLDKIVNSEIKKKKKQSTALLKNILIIKIKVTLLFTK